MRVNIKPVSINEAYRGRRFKTEKYKSFIKEFTLNLKPMKFTANSQLSLDLIFGFSSHGSDIDNCVKTTTDVLQKKFGFNDNQIYELTVKKWIVPKGKEFIKFDLQEI